jgi:hypothetical protein
MSSKKLVNGVSSGCLTIFGLPFLAAGVFLSWLYFTPSPVPLIPESGTTTKIVLGIYTVWAAIVIAPLIPCV